MNYQEFLKSKQVRAQSHGIEIDKSQINPLLFPFQQDIVRWALHKGQAAIFADTGLGKTFMQIEWARLISKTNALIIAPLNVSKQTIREASKLGATIRYVKEQSEVCSFCF